MMDDKELDLGRRALTGDTDALFQLFEMHKKELTLAVRTTIPAELRGVISEEDCLQEVFLSIFDAFRAERPTFDINRPFRPWAVQIARNEVRDVLRSRRDGTAESNLLAQLESELTSSSSVVQREQVAQIIRATLATLHNIDRDVIELRVLMGKTGAETAAILQISPEAVHMRLHRGLRRLREIFGSLSRMGA